MLTHVHRSKGRKGGFSLIEFLVSISIVAIISTVVLVNHNKFQSTTLLSNLAYDIGLSIRQAQVFGTGVRTFNDDFDFAYGLVFNRTTPNSYIIFADRDNGMDYDTNERVETYTLADGYIISNLCGIDAGGENCFLESTEVLIMFERPNPNALFVVSEGGSYSSMKIEIQSPLGDTRHVTVHTVGQIAIEQ